MEDLATPMQHDVSVMPILPLQKVHDQTVPDQTPHKNIFSLR